MIGTIYCCSLISLYKVETFLVFILQPLKDSRELMFSLFPLPPSKVKQSQKAVSLVSRYGISVRESELVCRRKEAVSRDLIQQQPS